MNAKESKMTENDAMEIPQYPFGTILWMFAWPALWFTFLIYVIGKQFIPAGGTTPTWLWLAITTGAELVAGLVLLRREGYRLTRRALADRIRWRWPKGWKAWTLAGIVFVLGMSLSIMMGPVNRALAVSGHPDRWAGLCFCVWPARQPAPGNAVSLGG